MVRRGNANTPVRIQWSDSLQGVYISQVKPFQFGKTGGYMEKPAKDAGLAFSDLTTWILKIFTSKNAEKHQLQLRHSPIAWEGDYEASA